MVLISCFPDLPQRDACGMPPEAVFPNYAKYPLGADYWHTDH